MLATAGALCAAPAPAADPRAEAGFYVEAYGRIDPGADARAAHAGRIFERVRRAGERSNRRPARLLVIDSDGAPWAIALPDGHVVLARRALDVCDSMGEHADACLAFVLGHELAHLASNDFWHREVHRFMASAPGESGVEAFVRAHDGAAARELAADDRGYVHAALAGFDVAGLLRRSSPDFFSAWMDQTNARVSATHADAATRTALVRARLGDIAAKLPFFHYGVRLAHFDYCDDAVYFLREFQRVFPGREVLGNLGYCYLQMARQAMTPARAYLYWMPGLLDGETRAGPGGTRTGQAIRSLRSQAARDAVTGLLEQAVELLEQAVEADRDYVPARLNLAVAQLYLGRPHAARASLAEAAKLAPNDVAVKMLDALALHEQGDAELDLWPKAVQRLEGLLDRHRADPMQAAQLRYNLAQLLRVRPRPAEARNHFNALAGAAARLPVPIRAAVCRAQTRVTPAACAGKPADAARRASRRWPWPIAPAGLHRLDAAKVAGWARTPFDWFAGKLHGQVHVRPDGAAEVLELDGFAHLQVLRGAALPRDADPQAYCAAPLRVRSLAAGSVLSCDDWAVVMRGDEIAEAWQVAQ